MAKRLPIGLILHQDSASRNRSDYNCIRTEVRWRGLRLSEDPEDPEDRLITVEP